MEAHREWDHRVLRYCFRLEEELKAQSEIEFMKTVVAHRKRTLRFHDDDTLRTYTSLQKTEEFLEFMSCLGDRKIQWWKKKINEPCPTRCTSSTSQTSATSHGIIPDVPNATANDPSSADGDNSRVTLPNQLGHVLLEEVIITISLFLC